VIDELRAALAAACDEIEGTVQCETQHDDYRDDPAWKRAQEWRALIARTAPAEPIKVGQIVGHGNEWVYLQLDAGTTALRPRDRIKVKPVSEEWPFRIGIAVVSGVMGDIIHLERSCWMDISAIADGDIVYRVEPA